MSATVVIGTQRGDEGKGKIVDLLAEEFDYVVRYHGGPNAGHTVVHSDQTLKLHHIPSAVLRPADLLIGPGVIINPQILLEEIQNLKEAGIDLESRLFVDPRCHVILPYHPLIERFHAQLKEGNLDTGSTGRGIGPALADKAAYLGIRIEDLYAPNVLAEKLRINRRAKNASVYQLNLAKRNEIFDWEQMERGLREWSNNLRPFVKDTFNMVWNALDRGERILAEGAHGVYLDVDWGPYPYITASNAVPGNVNAGAGIAPGYINEVIGTMKAYMTIVGNAPFPTRIADEPLRTFIARTGGEVGTTTGRVRECGWLDLEIVEFANRLCDIDSLALTKLDVLDSLQTIPICVGYKFNGYHVSYTDLDVKDLWNVEPIYKELPGWGSSTSQARRWRDLPDNAKRYVGFVEKHLGVPVEIISVGPDREQTVVTE